MTGRPDAPHSPTHDGWCYSKLTGSYAEIGHQHGQDHAFKINEIISRMKPYTYWATGLTWDFLRQQVWNTWWPQTPQIYQEEMRGIARGVAAFSNGSMNVTAEDLFLWNSYYEVLFYYYPTFKNTLAKISNEAGSATPPPACSAFIAVGDFTDSGNVVLAHNSYTGFEMAYMQLILDIETPNKDRFVMQTSPGMICSNTDFGINNHGLMITETTIGGFTNYCPEFRRLNELLPEFVRARMAMEQATSFDDFKTILRDRNTGGYANSWLVGDREKKEIMRYELGYRYDAATTTNNGYYVGFNAPIDPRIRNLECENTGYMDIRRHQGARQVLLPALVEHEKGKLTADVAREVLGNHMDPYLSQINGKETANVCARNVDAHYELDSREYMSQIGRPLPFQPQGAVDGKTADATMARNMDFNARWGSSSDIGFDAERFFAKHPQYSDLKPYIDTRDANPWTTVAEIATATQDRAARASR
jgi:hypothetical protein